MILLSLVESYFSYFFLIGTFSKLKTIYTLLIQQKSYLNFETKTNLEPTCFAQFQ
jgi:hypothetical protein